MFSSESNCFIDVVIFRKNVKQFYNDTIDYRQSIIYQSFVISRLSQLQFNFSSFDNSTFNKNFVISKRQVDVIIVNVSRVLKRFRNENVDFISNKNRLQIRLFNIFNYLLITSFSTKKFINSFNFVSSLLNNITNVSSNNVDSITQNNTNSTIINEILAKKIIFERSINFISNSIVQNQTIKNIIQTINFVVQTIIDVFMIIMLTRMQ